MNVGIKLRYAEIRADQLHIHSQYSTETNLINNE